jgi:hypothetical protein
MKAALPFDPPGALKSPGGFVMIGKIITGCGSLVYFSRPWI